MKTKLVTRLACLLSLYISSIAISEIKAIPLEKKESTHQKLSVDDIAALQKKLKTYETISVKFTQTVFKSLRKKTINSDGQAFFQRPDKFRWSLLSPKPESWMHDGKDLYNYFPEKKEAIRYANKAAKGKHLKELVDIVLNFNHLLQKYTLQNAQRKNALVFMELLPKEPGEIEKTELVFDEARSFVKSIKMLFKGGNITTLDFSNPLFNVSPSHQLELPIKSIKIVDAL